jgi:hypothetical protein
MTTRQNAVLNERDQFLFSKSSALTPPDLFSPRLFQRMHISLLHGTVKELDENIDETVARVEADVGYVENGNSYNANLVFAVLLDVFWLFVFSARASIGTGPPRLRGLYFTHNDAPQSVGLLWTSDQLVAETST